MAVRHLGTLTFLMFSPLALVSCGMSDPNRLDRDEARSLVLSAVNLQPPDKGCFGFRTGGFVDGVAQGYWTESWITATGQPYFASATSDEVCLKRKMDIDPEIQGIADAGSPGYKEIEFYLSNAAIPDPARRFIVAGYRGQATARRYDDGWRIDGIIHYQPDDAPLPLSAANQSAIRADLAKEDKRIQELEAFDAQKQGAFNAMVQESRTAKKPYQTFHCDVVLGNKHHIMDVSINDVEIVIAGKDVFASSNVTQTVTYPFERILSYRVNGDWLETEMKIAGSRTSFASFYPKQCKNFDAFVSAFRKNYDPWWQKYSAVSSAQ